MRLALRISMSRLRSLSSGQTFSWILAGSSSLALGGCDSTSSCPRPESCNELCEGRRHATWGEVKPPLSGDARGRWFARAAANEAASVQSFRCLARELRRSPLGQVFSGRLRRAARQEIRHARLMRARARSHGVEIIGRSFHAAPERTLVEIALENAREGCVNETYAALVALHQSGHAADAELRDEFLEIALDETAHADLAWRLHEAFLIELQPSEATAVQTALRDALDALQNAPRGTALGRAERKHLGLASPEVDRHLRQELFLALQDRAGRLGFSAG